MCLPTGMGPSTRGESPQGWRCSIRLGRQQRGSSPPLLRFSWLTTSKTWQPPVPTGSSTRAEMMSPNTPTVDDLYRRYADLLLEHHRLLYAGREDDAETEAVEEEMTQLWERLDLTQRGSLAGLGS